MRDTPLHTPTIEGWIFYASTQLAGAGIGTAKLDAEIILAHTLRKSRTYLHAHGDELLTPREREIADARMDLRCDRTPIAYIIGHKEFYGRSFKVTPATLIPRPESEAMITLLKQLVTKPAGKRLVDVGTGSGALGITAKLELPQLDVTLTDISQHALTVAESNARVFDADVSLLRSNLLTQYDGQADIIMANLPYVDRDWERSPETNHEPALALFADDHGLALIDKLIEEADDTLTGGGLLLLEADPRQHHAITSLTATHHLTPAASDGFILAFRRA